MPIPVRILMGESDLACRGQDKNISVIAHTLTCANERSMQDRQADSVKDHRDHWSPVVQFPYRTSSTDTS